MQSPSMPASKCGSGTHLDFTSPLRDALTSAGFADESIAVRAFREGARADVADLDLVLRNDETIYLEATA